MESLPPPPDALASLDDPGFLADLRTALRVWKRHPFLPLLTVALWAITTIKSPVIWPFVLIMVSWPGVERIWYLRAFNGDTITPKEGARLWRAFFWRFVALSLLMTLPLFALIVVFRPDPDRAQSWIAIAVSSIILDFVLTFVTQALSFTTRSVRGALRIGFTMIRSEWPRCAWYVLAPPLAAQLVFGLHWISSLGIVGIRVGAGLAVVFGLAFKGATAAFYLRRHLTTRDGSAWREESAGLAPSMPVPPGVSVRKESIPAAPRRRPNVPAAKPKGKTRRTRRG